MPNSVFGTSDAVRAGETRAKGRSALCWKACVVRRASPGLCRRDGISQNLYCRWSKEFLEAGKKRLAGDTTREATSDEVKDLRREATALKEVVADLTLENRRRVTQRMSLMTFSAGALPVPDFRLIFAP